MKLAIVAAVGVMAETKGRNPMNHLSQVFETAESFILAFKEDHPGINIKNRVSQFTKTRDRLERIWRR